MILGKPVNIVQHTQAVALQLMSYGDTGSPSALLSCVVMKLNMFNSGWCGRQHIALDLEEIGG